MVAADDSSSTPPPGWYPDPTDRSQQRYWDGGSWTRHTGREAQSQTARRHSDGAGPDVGPVATWERASFVVTYLLGGLLFGPVAMRYAGKAAGARDAGDRRTARTLGRRARAWTIIAGIVGLATLAAVAWALGLLGALDPSLVGL